MWHFESKPNSSCHWGKVNTWRSWLWMGCQNVCTDSRRFLNLLLARIRFGGRVHKRAEVDRKTWDFHSSFLWGVNRFGTWVSSFQKHSLQRLKAWEFDDWPSRIPQDHRFWTLKANWGENRHYLWNSWIYGSWNLVLDRIWEVSWLLVFGNFTLWNDLRISSF